MGERAERCFQIDGGISCHDWNQDMTLAALCPNNSEILIFKILPENQKDSWKLLYTLKQHENLVSDLRWAPKSNKIVSCSHDRNAYVWTFQDENWKPSLVILRMNRAALCVDWSPKENKFAVGSASKSACVCHYDPEQDWWVAKVIKKGHTSSVVGVAWHPNNLYLATTSTDGKCRVFAAGIKGVDSKSEMAAVLGESKYGELLLQLDLCHGWCSAAAWSPSGSTLLFASHASSVCFVEVADGMQVGHKQVLPLSVLPLRKVVFLSESEAVGVGHGSAPVMFLRQAHAQEPEAEETPSFAAWTVLPDSGAEEASVDVQPNTSSPISGFFAKLATEIFNKPSRPSGQLRHDSCITSLSCLLSGSKFSTAALDGKLLVWSKPSLPTA